MKKQYSLLLLVSAGMVVVSHLTNPGFKPTRVAYASDEPRVIEISAKKFEFTPPEITLKKGEPVILRLTSEDRTHGFLVKPLKIDADIVPGKPTEVALTPATAGSYTVICDHYCGTGHGNMKLKMTVTE